MIKMISVALSVALLAPLSASASDAVHIACATSNPSSKDWVPVGVVVRVRPGAMQAAVIDEFTQQVFGGGVSAALARPTPNRLRMKWKLVGAKDRKGRAQNVDFKMNVNLKTGKFTYQGLSESFFVTPGSAEGLCVPFKLKKQ